MRSDPFDLERFVSAQADVYGAALTELRAGRKTSHWMWFVFPQIDGLGSSSTAKHFAIRSLDEARAYRKHPELGPHLLECVEAVMSVRGKSALQIFGSPDDVKFRSSMTLFDMVSPAENTFDAALQRYFGGERDERTIALAGGGPG